MKKCLKIALLLLLPVFAISQSLQKQLDSLQHLLQTASNDTLRMNAYGELALFFDDVDLDSTIYYGEKGAVISKKLDLKLNEAEAYMGQSFPLSKLGNYPQAFKVLTQALEIAQNPANEKNTWGLQKGLTPETYRLRVLGFVYIGFGVLHAYTN